MHAASFKRGPKPLRPHFRHVFDIFQYFPNKNQKHIFVSACVEFVKDHFCRVFLYCAERICEAAKSFFATPLMRKLSGIKKQLLQHPMRKLSGRSERQWLKKHPRSRPQAKRRKRAEPRRRLPADGARRKGWTRKSVCPCIVR